MAFQRVEGVVRPLSYSTTEFIAGRPRRHAARRDLGYHSGRFSHRLLPPTALRAVFQAPGYISRSSTAPTVPASRDDINLLYAMVHIAHNIGQPYRRNYSSTLYSMSKATGSTCSCSCKFSLLAQLEISALDAVTVSNAGSKATEHSNQLWPTAQITQT